VLLFRDRKEPPCSWPLPARLDSSAKNEESAPVSAILCYGKGDSPRKHRESPFIRRFVYQTRAIALATIIGALLLASPEFNFGSVCSGIFGSCRGAALSGL
jgi:hypothetical protein